MNDKCDVPIFIQGLRLHSPEVVSNGDTVNFSTSAQWLIDALGDRQVEMLLEAVSDKYCDNDQIDESAPSGSGE